ncbi:MAG TPA: hypothetical protein VFE31_04825 [Opitutaceae bacterium]|nr:hypothetical protein [Opitutaceae bacterium]
MKAAFGAAALLWHRDVAERRELAAENARLRADVARLTAVRVEPAPQRSAPPARPGAEAAPRRNGAPPSLAPGLVPVATLGDRGTRTARDAFATQLWAARTGDVDREASLLSLSPGERALLQDLLARLPPDLAAQYNTPEKLLAFALAGSPHPVAGMTILGETQEDPDDVVLQTQWQHADDPVVHTSNAVFHQEQGEWKWVVPPIIVERAAAYLGRGD